jgi:hypothetical protein
MPIPLGTKFLTYKGAPKNSGYEVTKILPDKNYWCANIIHKKRGDEYAGTIFPKDVLEKMVKEPWQPAGFGLKKKASISKKK